MKSILFLSFVLIMGFGVDAQKIVPQVVASSGGQGQSGQYSLAWTIGEAGVATGQSGNYILTQGFHQPHLSVVIGSVDLDLNIDVSVFPNPILSGVNIQSGESGLKYRIVDMEGNMVASTKEILKNNQYVDLSRMTSGVFLIQILRQNRLVKIVKIEKLK